MFEFGPTDSGRLVAFLELEGRLMRQEEWWIPPDLEREIRFLEGKSPKNVGLEHRMFMSDDARSARCAAFVNRRWGTHQGDAETGFIGFIAAAQDAMELLGTVLESAEDWLVTKGCNRVILGFDGVPGGRLGIRCNDFDRPPRFPEPWQPPFYMVFLDDLGYARYKPWLSWSFDLHAEELISLSQRVLARSICSVRPFRSADRDSELTISRDLFNTGFAASWDYYPMSQGELEEEFSSFGLLGDAEQILFAEVQGVPAGVCIGAPDLSDLMRSLQGVSPTEEQIRAYLRHDDCIKASPNTLAVHPDFRGMHVGPVLLASLFQVYKKRGMGDVEALYVDADNVEMVSLMTAFGGRPTQRYTHFTRKLDARPHRE